MSQPTTKELWAWVDSRKCTTLREVPINGKFRFPCNDTVYMKDKPESSEGKYSNREYYECCKVINPATLEVFWMNWDITVSEI